MLYTIKIQNAKGFRYELIRFCENYKISTYITYMQEDIFTDILFVDLLVPDSAIERFESKYKEAITHKEKL